MSAAYVCAPPQARADGDMLWLEFESGKETISLALTRNAAIHLLREVTQEARGPLFALPKGEVLPFKKAKRKGSAKRERAA